MKLVLFSRRKLNAASDLQVVFDAAAGIFGCNDFRFSVQAGRADEMGDPFNVQQGVALLQAEGTVSFFKHHVAAVRVDNQAFNNAYFIYPHSIVEIETVGVDEAKFGKMDNWLLPAEKLLDQTRAELGIVLGREENAADYFRIPFSVGIGLIRVFWITCFGPEYSRLIGSKAGASSFYKRVEFGSRGSQAFVSAPSYPEYVSAPCSVIEAQRREIGVDLFHRCPAEKKATGNEVSWLFSPKTLLRLASSFLSEQMKDWRKCQAKIVPEPYK